MSKYFSPRRAQLRFACLAGWLAVWTCVFSERVDAAPWCVPVDGAAFEARLMAVDGQWFLEFESGGKNNKLSANEIVTWGAPAEATAGTRLLLADGGMLIADVKEADRDRITVSSSLFGELQIPLELLAGVVLQAAGDTERVERQMTRVRTAEGNADRLFLDNGDVLTGSLRALQMNGAGGGTIKLEAEVGPIEIAVDRVLAIAFNPTLVSRPAVAGLQSMVGFRDGSCLRALSLDLSVAAGADGAAWITLPGKLTWQTSPNEIAFLQPLGDRVRYLSDLAAAGYRQIPFLDTPGVSWELGRDTSVSGKQLRVQGVRFLKGLGMHSASRVSYELTPEDRRFEASIALDDEAGSRGSVVFRVYVDNEQKYASPVIRGGAAPLPISVDVQGGQRLNLIVDFADRGDQLDRADWLNARLVK